MHEKFRRTYAQGELPSPVLRRLSLSMPPTKLYLDRNSLRPLVGRRRLQSRQAPLAWTT